jgi:hypothetical protein
MPLKVKLDEDLPRLRKRSAVRGETVVEVKAGDAYTNTAESWIALLKRGIMGSFHHVSEEQLDRYANEFAFRWIIGK